ncbi:MAG: hypothetical protein R2712_12240 [Vicinamibacterales bacterium]
MVQGRAGRPARERFRPIADRAKAIWQQLRQQSNVELEAVALKGTATQRAVELSVTVDGVPGAALGVMSQGELNALALSLFMPRASLPESPFRFMVIDDPVQSMDPARVDGRRAPLPMPRRHGRSSCSRTTSACPMRCDTCRFRPR